VGMWIQREPATPRAWPTRTGALHDTCRPDEADRGHERTRRASRRLPQGGVMHLIPLDDMGSQHGPVAGFRSVIRLCLALGYGEADIRKMISLNACRL